MKRVILGPRAVTEAVRAHAGELSVVYVSEDGRRELAELSELARVEEGACRGAFHA